MYDADLDTCTWEAEDPTIISAVVLTLQPFTEDDWAFYGDLGTPESPNSELSGSGDEAIRLGGILDGVIAVRKGSRIAEVQIYGTAEDDIEQIRQDLARLMASRM